MIRTCKNHDSRVHNYWIHYMSLCILLKLAIWCVVQFRRYEFKIVWSPHVIFKHQVISAIKTLLMFMIKLCMLEFDQTYFVKMPFERSISWFQNNRKTKERHVLFKDEMWPQNKMQDGKIHNKNDWQFNPFLDQPLWQYLCFAKQFRSLVILRMFWRQFSQWHPPSQTPLVSCSPTSGLDSWNSCKCSIEMAEEPLMIFTSRLAYSP